MINVRAKIVASPVHVILNRCNELFSRIGPLIVSRASVPPKQNAEQRRTNVHRTLTILSM